MIKKAEWIVETLEAMFPNAKAELDFTNNFELLVAVCTISSDNGCSS